MVWNGVAWSLFLALYAFFTFRISWEQRRSHVLATLVRYWGDIPATLERRPSEQSVLFSGCWALDLRAAVLPEQRFYFSSCGVKSFVVYPLSWNLDAESNRMPSALTMRPLSASGPRAWSLELLRLLDHPRSLTAWRWKVWETRANDNDVVCLYHRNPLSPRHPWPYRSRTSNP